MKLVLNNPDLAKAHGKKPGDTIEVKDKNGVPVDRYWRNRLKDSALDKCVSVVKATKTKAKEG